MMISLDKWKKWKFTEILTENQICFKTIAKIQIILFIIVQKQVHKNIPFKNIL